MADGTPPHPHPIPDHHVFEFDLTADEARRRAEAMAAMEPDWDPLAAMEAEAQAHRMLYSGLDDAQQAVYDRLVAAGVLPPHPGGGHAPT